MPSESSRSSRMCSTWLVVFIVWMVLSFCMTYLAYRTGEKAGGMKSPWGREGEEEQLRSDQIAKIAPVSPRAHKTVWHSGANALKAGWKKGNDDQQSHTAEQEKAAAALQRTGRESTHSLSAPVWRLGERGRERGRGERAGKGERLRGAGKKQPSRSLLALHQETTLWIESSQFPQDCRALNQVPCPTVMIVLRLGVLAIPSTRTGLPVFSHRRGLHACWTGIRCVFLAVLFEACARGGQVRSQAACLHFRVCDIWC